MTKSQIIVMCSILSLISFKSTERLGTKVFLHIWSVLLPIWQKNMLQTFFQHFFSFNIWHYFSNYQLYSIQKIGI